MNRFKKDRNYLLFYCAKSLTVFVALDLILFYSQGINFNFSISSSDLLLPLLAIVFCGLPSSLMHNCAHGNIKPRWLNESVGAACGTFMLYGYRGFALAHMFHHKYPDDPTMDPHPSRGQNFLEFVVSPIKATLLVVERAYYGYFGKNESTVTNIKIQLVLFNLAMAARVMFWLVLLGPKFFLMVYLPIYAANIFVFAHINFAAHRERSDTSSEIINLNHNLYYKFINLVSFGGYFHKSHHLKPTAFNPAKVVIDDSIDYITYTPKEDLTNNMIKMPSYPKPILVKQDMAQ